MFPSILDNDLYKFTMQQAVLSQYRGVPVTYEFTNRRPEYSERIMGEVYQEKFGVSFHDALRKEIDDMGKLRLTDAEADFLKSLPFIDPTYVEWLRNYRYNPDQVRTNVVGGRLNMTVEGPWEETILWEVPLMAAISQVYFRVSDQEAMLFNAKYGQAYAQKTAAKGQMLQGYNFSDFGTRRRRNASVQDIVVGTLKNFPGFMGTSNVHLAMKHGVKPIGTMAHEWIMGVSALEGLRHANRHALRAWNNVYKGRLGYALTDTFGTKAFWEDFDGELARLFDGVRHDSNDPFEFGRAAIEHYNKLGIYTQSKTLVFSDGLNPQMAVQIAKEFQDKIRVVFGIGTNFTNDFEGEPALNMVIKLRTCNRVPVVKLSDVPTKATGDRDALRVAMWTFFGKPLNG